jgi:hypothetical protein
MIALNHALVDLARKSYDFAIFASVNLLAVGLLVVILANAPAPFQESIQSTLIE